MSEHVKHTNGQSFWLGATSALALVLGLLLIGVINGSVAFPNGDTKATEVAPSAVPTPVAVPEAGEAIPTEPENIAVQPVTDQDWVRGSRNAEISIIEFSDIECPFCSRFHETMNSVVEKYDGKVNWVYRHFPLAFHPQAEPAAIGAECVGELGGNDAFWSFIDEAFANQATLGPDVFATAATNAGVNAVAFETCVSEKRYADKIADHTTQAAAAGGSGTPHSVIVANDGETLIQLRGAQPQAQVEALIDPLLQ